MTMVLPKKVVRTNQNPPKKLATLDQQDAFTLWVVVVSDEEILLVTTSKRKARRAYKKAAGKYLTRELWKKTVSLVTEGKPMYQVIDSDGIVLREYPSLIEVAGYQSGHGGETTLRRVTVIPNPR